MSTIILIKFHFHIIAKIDTPLFQHAPYNQISLFRRKNKVNILVYR